MGRVDRRHRVIRLGSQRVADVIRFAPYFVIVVLMGAGGILWSLNESLRADNAEKDADLKRQAVIIEKQIEVQRQHHVYIERVEQERQVWAEIMADLDIGEGGDAELSDYLGAGAGRLWP